MASPDPELRKLQQMWAPAWSVWRARRPEDLPDAPTGSFMATRPARGRELGRTLMEPTAERLDAALHAEQHLAGQSFGW